MPEPLTPRQLRAFRVIEQFITTHGYAPSYDEMREALSLASKSTVFRRIRELERKGWVRTYRRRTRGIELLVVAPSPPPASPSSSFEEFRARLLKLYRLNRDQLREHLGGEWVRYHWDHFDRNRPTFFLAISDDRARQIFELLEPAKVIPLRPHPSVPDWPADVQPPEGA